MHRAACSIMVVGLLATSGVAIHYRNQSYELSLKLAAQDAQARQPQDDPSLEPEPSDPATPVASAPKQGGAAMQDQKSATEIAARDRRIRQLEEALQSKDLRLASLQNASTNRAADTTRTARRGSAWLESLKQSDPPQYDAITQRMEQVRQEVQNSVAKKASFFRDRDPSTMSEAERSQYQRMTQLLDDSWRLTEQLQTELPSDARRAAANTLRQNMHELGPMLATERTKTWYNLGLQLGYKEADAQAFGDYLNKVIEVTSVQSISRAMRANASGDARRTAPRTDR